MIFNIRNFNIEFPEKNTIGDITSGNGLFRWQRYSGGSPVNTRFIFLGANATYPSTPHIYAYLDKYKFDYGISFFSDTTVVPSNPWQIYLQDYLMDGHLTINKFELNDWYLDGWTVSDLAVFKNELCTSFKSKINALNLNWEDDVNFIFISLTFADSPGEIFYFTIFYEGNTQQADEVITI